MFSIILRMFFTVILRVVVSGSLIVDWKFCIVWRSWVSVMFLSFWPGTAINIASLLAVCVDCPVVGYVSKLVFVLPFLVLSGGFDVNVKTDLVRTLINIHTLILHLNVVSFGSSAHCLYDLVFHSGKILFFIG